MAEVKTAAAKPSNAQGYAGKPKNSSNFMINFILVLCCIAAGILIYFLVLGNSGNFQDALKEKPKNFMGTMYSGGFVVPILMATLLTLACFIVERALTIIKAKG